MKGSLRNTAIAIARYIQASTHAPHQNKREIERRKRQFKNGVRGGQYPEFERIKARNITSDKRETD